MRVLDVVITSAVGVGLLFLAISIGIVLATAG